MSAPSPQAPARPLPAPGHYPVPDHHGRRVVERGWDGEVWLPESRPAPEGTALPAYKRHFFGFLQHWKLLLAVLVPAAIASALWAGDTKADWVSGAQLLMPALAFLATTAVMVALVLFLSRRVDFDRIDAERRRIIIRWGVLSAVVGFVFAFAIELGVPELLGGDPKERGWSALAGPAEETGKLLIPVVLWLRGHFRLPREGYLLVLATAGAFGAMESVEYALNPDHWQPARLALELMHPLLTGFVAAVAWQAAYRRDSIFTGAAIGAWAIAMLAHSTNDLIVLDKDAGGVLDFITITVVVVMYLLQKHSARQLVPPDNVGAVSPHWRPRAPRSL